MLLRQSDRRLRPGPHRCRKKSSRSRTERIFHRRYLYQNIRTKVGYVAGKGEVGS